MSKKLSDLQCQLRNHLGQIQQVGFFHLLLAFFSVQGVTYLTQLTLARILGPEQFGIVRRVEIIVQILVTLSSAGMPTLAVKSIAEISDLRLRGQLLGRLIQLVFCTALLVIGINQLLYLFVVPSDLSPFLAVLTLSIAMTSTSRTIMNYFQGSKEIKQLSYYLFGLSAVTFSLILVGVLLCHMSGWLVGRLGGEILYLLCSWLIIRRVLATLAWQGSDLPVRYSHVNLLKMGLPILLTFLLRLLVDNLPILALGYYNIPERSLGHFGLASLITTGLLIVPGAACNIAIPYFVEKLQRSPEAARIFFGKIVKIMVPFVLFMTIATLILGEGVPYVFGEQYAETVSLLRILVLGLPFRSILMLASTSMLAGDHIRHINFYTAIEIGLTLVICKAIIIQYGSVGAAWGVVGVQAVGMLLSMFLCWRSVLTSKQTLFVG